MSRGQFLRGMLDWIEGHPGTAAWAQAIGSLLSIWVVITVPILQRRVRARAVMAQLIPKIQAVGLATSAFAHSLLNNEKEDDIHRLADLREALDQLTHPSLSDLTLKDVVRVTSLRRALERLVSTPFIQPEEFRGRPDDPSQQAYLMHRLRRVRGVLDGVILLTPSKTLRLIYQRSSDDLTTRISELRNSVSSE